MDYVVRFFRFWYKFLISDDWIGATIVLLGFGAPMASPVRARSPFG
jgi:hypothetical protein